MVETFTIVVTVLAIIFFLLWINKGSDDRNKVNELQSKLQSSYVLRGNKIETLVPLSLMKDNKDFFRDDVYLTWIGKPIDFFAFFPDKIEIIEVKSGDAQMNERELNIKKLIENGKVYHRVIRI